MKLRISQIKLKNFKVFEEIVIYANNSFNIIIGENGSGKSTIFEAIQLWEKCYKICIQESRKKFYQLDNSLRYLNYQDLDFLRVTQDHDLFFHYWQPIEIEIKLVLDDLDFNLGFRLSRPSSISNSYFRIQMLNGADFLRFSDSISQKSKMLDEVIFIYQTRPVAGVSRFEPYYNEAQIKKKIQRGFSHEVLRNKIVSRRETITSLELNISEIIERRIKFDLPPKTREKKYEFIKLKVSFDQGISQDIHLQGSGFLQVAEIISTVEYIDAPLKLLLVDEPDSHIHSRLQCNLINNLKKIDHNQFFVISHNDQFVSNAKDDEVFFLNALAKRSKELRAIPSNSFDIIKKAMGGVILSLEQLNQAENIVFVEGRDDEYYIKKLALKFSAATGGKNNIQKFNFFPLRGKDNIATKIEYNKRTLSNLFKEKRWITIFDKDFSTDNIDRSLKNSLEVKMGRNSIAYSHDGYCIESSLFSDKEVLCKYLQKLALHIEYSTIESAVVRYLDNISETFVNVTSDICKELNGGFLGQKNNRPEFEGLSFDAVLNDWHNNGCPKLQNLMTKGQINKFVNTMENELGWSLFLRSSNSDEEVSSMFLNNYIDSITSESDIYPSFLYLLNTLGIVEPPAL